MFDIKDYLNKKTILSKDEIKIIEDKAYDYYIIFSTATEAKKRIKNIQFNKYDKLSVSQLITIASRLIGRHSRGEKEFLLGMTLVSNLIYLIKSNYEIEEDKITINNQLAKIYDFFVDLTIDLERYHSVYFSDRSKQYNFDKDNDFALQLLKEISLLAPTKSSPYFKLGLYYMFKFSDYYHRLIARNYFSMLWLNDYADCIAGKSGSEDDYWLLLEGDSESSIITELGYLLETENDDLVSAFKMYSIAVEIDKSNDLERKDAYALYNLAACYINGIGTDVNIEEGKRLLSILFSAIDLNEGAAEVIKQDTDNIIKFHK